MRKVIDLTGLSRAITKIKEWVNGILDWNAQEGQDGYIRNKTHGIKYYTGTYINSTLEGYSANVWNTIAENINPLYDILASSDYFATIRNPIIYSLDELNTEDGRRISYNGPDLYLRYYDNKLQIKTSFITNSKVTIESVLLDKLHNAYISSDIARQSEITRVENDFKQKLAKKANEPTFRMYYLDRSLLRDRMTHAELNACFEGNELDDLLTNCWDSIIPVALRVTYGSYRGTTLYVTKSVYSPDFSEEDAEAGYTGTEGCSEVIFGSLVGIDEGGLHAIRFAWDFAEHIWYVSIYED